MKANKPYFSHDEGARNDPKLVQVMMDLGHEGKSVYWDLVEMLYEQGGYLMLSQCKSYAFALRTSCELILKLVNDFDLFVSDGAKFWSESALVRLGQRNAKSLKAAESAAKRWGTSERNANALPPHSEGNAIKVKESKVKETPSDEGGSPPAPVLESASLKANKPDAPRRAAATFRPDEAPVFTASGLRAFADRIGFRGIDVGYYLPLMQRAAEKTGEQRPNDGPGKTWEDFVTHYLELERRHNRVVYPVTAAQPPGYPAPNPALQLTTSTTSYSPEAIAARNVVKY